MSLSNLQLAGALKRTQQGDADWYYGGDDAAWPDLATAKAGVPTAIRPGKTVGILISGKVVEYWWPDPEHVADGDLIAKSPSDLVVNSLEISGTGGLDITRSGYVATSVVNANSIDYPDGTVVNLIGTSVKNISNKIRRWVFQSASLFTGQNDETNVFYLPVNKVPGVPESLVTDADIKTKADKLITSSLQTGPSYALTLNDAFTKIRIDNGLPNTVTIPSNSSTAFDIGTQIILRNIGNGITTIIPETGVTIHGQIEILQYCEASLTQEAADVWSVTIQLGDTSGIFSSFGRWIRDNTTNKLKYIASVFQQGGTGNALQIPNLKTGLSSDIGLPSGNSDWSVYIVFKAPINFSLSMLTWGNTNINGQSLGIGIGGDGNIYITTNTGSNFGVVGAPAMGWNHLLVSKAGNTIRIYKNGILSYTTDFSLNIVLGNGFTLNTPAFGWGSYGYTLGQVLIYNRGLTQSSGFGFSDEVAQLYNDGTGTGSPAVLGLQVWYDINEGTGSNLINKGALGNTNDLTFTAGTIWLGEGNGIVPIAGSDSVSSAIEIGNGVATNERGRGWFGDFLMGTILRGVTLTGTVNGLLAWYTANNAKTFFSDRVTSETQAKSTVDIDGTLTIGQSYAGNYMAPVNGIMNEGRHLSGTTTDNLIDQEQINGHIALTTSGNKLKIATGINASIGVTTLAAGTVTVNTTAVAANSIIWLQRKTNGGTPGLLTYASIIPETSFVVNSDSTADTSTVNWWIIN